MKTPNNPFDKYKTGNCVTLAPPGPDAVFETDTHNEEGTHKGDIVFPSCFAPIKMTPSKRRAIALVAMVSRMGSAE